MKWPQERAEVTHLSSHSPLCPEGAPSACPGEIRASQNPGPSGCCLDLDFAGEEAPHPCGSQIHPEMLGLEQGHTSLPSPHRGPGHLVPGGGRRRPQAGLLGHRSQNSYSLWDMHSCPGGKVAPGPWQ